MACCATGIRRAFGNDPDATGVDVTPDALVAGAASVATGTPVISGSRGGAGEAAGISGVRDTRVARAVRVGGRDARVDRGISSDDWDSGGGSARSNSTTFSGPAESTA
ncbi:MAG: hypothetical protein V2A73_22995 [Pseudomonadota bacterium]